MIDERFSWYVGHVDCNDIVTYCEIQNFRFFCGGPSFAFFYSLAAVRNQTLCIYLNFILNP